MLGATFLLIQVAKRFDSSIMDEIDDPSAHAFENWFAEAKTGAVEAAKDRDVTVKGVVDEESEEVQPEPVDQVVDADYQPDHLSEFEA